MKWLKSISLLKSAKASCSTICLLLEQFLLSGGCNRSTRAFSSGWLHVAAGQPTLSAPSSCSCSNSCPSVTYLSKTSGQACRAAVNCLRRQVKTGGVHLCLYVPSGRAKSDVIHMFWAPERHKVVAVDALLFPSPFFLLLLCPNAGQRWEKRKLINRRNCLLRLVIRLGKFSFWS